MLWRFIGRNFPHHVDAGFLTRWKSFCASRILFPPDDGALSLSDYKEAIAEKRKKGDIPVRDLTILKKLEEYAVFLEKNILDYSAD